MRLQLLRERVGIVHAIAFTHHHADHLFGLDDARLFPKCDRRPGAGLLRGGDRGDDPPRLPLRLPRAAARAPGRASCPSSSSSGSRPGSPFEVLGQTILPIRLEHGRFRVLGFRVGDLAYCTDVSRIPEESWPLLEGLDS